MIKQILLLLLLFSGGSMAVRAQSELFIQSGYGNYYFSDGKYSTDFPMGGILVAGYTFKKWSVYSGMEVYRKTERKEGSHNAAYYYDPYVYQGKYVMHHHYTRFVIPVCFRYRFYASSKINMAFGLGYHHVSDIDYYSGHPDYNGVYGKGKTSASRSRMITAQVNASYKAGKRIWIDYVFEYRTYNQFINKIGIQYRYSIKE